ncbi:MAG TPA: lysophospholipid acyltransferase family protein [Acidobacteriota bacterium]|nr:lysophospholipid acyltransferase family protein [Acidobacteriota bacterium]
MGRWFAFVRWSASVIYHLLWWPRLEGRDHFPDGPYIICPNHRSWFDPPLVSVLTHWREIGFLAKAELHANPIISRLLWSWNACPIRRGAIDRTAIRQVMALLERGIPMLVFPEGTRSRTGKMLPPRPGVGLLARNAAVPVVPAYIFGSFRIGRAPFCWGRLRMRAGPPITVEEIQGFGDNKEGYRALSRHILERICDLGDDPARDRAAAFGDAAAAPR